MIVLQHHITDVGLFVISADVTINSRIIGPGKINNDDEEKTFIGGVYIETKHHFVDITADSILIKDLKLLQRAGQQENPLRFIKKHKKSLVVMHI